MYLLEWAKRKKSDVHVLLQKGRILAGEKKYCDRKSFMERDMLLYAHSLEKGMGIQNARKGYGKEKALALVNILKDYSSHYNTDTFPFLESIAVLDKYIELMKEQNESIEQVIRIRNTIDSYDAITNYCKSGYDHLSYDYLNTVDASMFESVLSSRHSIRHYSKDVITEDELLKVVKLANMAPSACNRQPTKIYYTKTQDNAKEFEKMIDGSHGFQGEVPYYLLVTTDRSYFGTDEYLQWYTNGGIYLGFLTLAFHACGMGSIILQWKYAQECESKVKSIFGIKETEAIVAIMGFGKYPKNGTKCILAQRKRPEDTIQGI